MKAEKLFIYLDVLVLSAMLSVKLLLLLLAVTNSLHIQQLVDIYTRPGVGYFKFVSERIDYGSSNKGSTKLRIQSLTDSVPSEINWLHKGAVSEVKDQGKFYVSWAFTVTGIIEGAVFLNSSKSVSLSEQNLIDCCTRACKSRDPDEVLEYVKTKQDGVIDTEWSYRYKGKRDKCHKITNIGARINAFKSDLLKGDDEKLKSIVAFNGPVGVKIDGSKPSFREYKQGIYEDPKCKKNARGRDVTHLLLVGYGTENGTDFWIAKGSFGIQWGEKGYIRLNRSIKNVCGIANKVTYVPRT